MHHSRFSFIFVAFAAALLTACGGGGSGFAIDANPLVITSNSIDPTLVSGDVIDWEIPLDGGCSGSGPFVVEVISGALPDGVGVDYENGRHHLTGAILEDGNFDFTVKVTDSSCEPFATTFLDFSWSVAQGPVRIVGCNPPLVPNADFDDPLKYPDADALETVVYSSFVNYDLIVAGGQGPYTCSLVDDPADPDDGSLPVGLSFAVNSCSLVGSPTEVGPAGRPFRYTIRVTDSVGNTSDLKLQHKIDTPPIILATTGLNSGQAGQIYSDAVTAIDGVPPLAFELLDNAPDDDGDSGTAGNENDNVTYTAGQSPTINGFVDAGLPFQLTAIGPADVARLQDGVGRSSYPAETDDGPNYGPFPPEGVYMTETGPSAGVLAGIPRRRGTFTLNVHVYSTLVPNERGQHAFRQLDMVIASADPMAMDLSFTVEGQLASYPTADGYPTLPIAEQTVQYNPDAGTGHIAQGLLLKATGGVQFDGYTDQPHKANRVLASPTVERVGLYSWSGDMDPSDQTGGARGPWGTLPDAFSLFDPFGRLGTGDDALAAARANSLIRTLRRQLDLTVTDHALPLSVRGLQSQRFGLEVGPDVVIITQSTSSLSGIYNYWSAPNRHDWDAPDHKILKFVGFSSGPQRQALTDLDLTATHTVPAAADLASSGNALGDLLSGETTSAPNLDLLRCGIVATGWWDDMHSLNPKGGRSYFGADANKGYSYSGEFGSRYSNHGNYQPSVSSIDLPDVENLAADEANGIFTNGGRLHHFESATHFGAFVIRSNGTIYVPFAYKKDTTYAGFGDGLLRNRGSNTNSAFRTVQMTISPDGRFGAMKLKRTPSNLYENASDSGIVLFSLAGEKVFGESSTGANDGDTYVVIASGVGNTGTGNRILHASSMALTNNHLYFLIGSRSASGTSTSFTPMYYQSFSGHYLMRYEITGGATEASLLPSASGDIEWYNTSGTPMQTTYHHHGPNNSSSYPMWESSTTYGLWPYHRYWQEDGMNLNEHGAAPTPFRVSADGSAVAFMAAQDMYSTYSTNVYSNYAWVDYEGSGARRATTTRRHCYMGSGRPYTMVHGPNEYAMWGRYSGPTTGLEISDDGLAVAFVYNTNSSTISSTSSYSSSSHPWMRYRDNIHLVSTSSTDQWATLGSTTQDSVTASTFGGSHRWRFGSLAFTKDGAGLVFWGGAPVYQGNSTSYQYNQSYQMAGTYYIHELGTTNSVDGMCSTTEGGQGTSTYTSTSPFNPSTTNGSSSSSNVSSNYRYGVIIPMGGFMSKSRDMLYIVAYGALSTSDATACKLVGLNISTVPDGSSINTSRNHANGEAFLLTGWPSRRGFLGNYIYYPYYPLYYGYAPMKKQGLGMQVMAKDTGWVFFGANYQYSGPGRYYYYGGPPIRSYYYGAYGYGGVGMYGFNADLGGDIKQLNDPSNSPNSTSSSNWGKLNYMTVARDGSRLSYQFSMQYRYDHHSQERIRAVRDIDFSTAGTGVMHAGFVNTQDQYDLQSSNGRAGEAMAPSATSPADIWYSFKAGAGNETAQEIVRATYDPGSDSWTFTRFPTLPGRMSTLYATR